MFKGLGAGLGYPGGFPAWSMLCLTDPDYVHAYHDVVSAAAIRRIDRVLPRIAPYVDIMMLSADDQELQDRTILPPRVLREPYVPYYRRVTAAGAEGSGELVGRRLALRGGGVTNRGDARSRRWLRIRRDPHPSCGDSG